MKRWLPLAVLAGALLAFPSRARAKQSLDLDHINVTYHGDRLMQHVHAVTLFWGPGWDQTPLRDYLNGFFRALFTDGRYLANLAQYSMGNDQIGNGELGGTATDTGPVPAVLPDDQIRAEIRAQVAAGHLPPPDADTLYVVFPPPGVTVVNEQSETSTHDFAGYHDYTWIGDFAYAVIPYAGDKPEWMTTPASHELAEAVTDPQPYLQVLGRGGWYDDINGEIADIPLSLHDAFRIKDSDLWDFLPAADGTQYKVQKVWSNRDHAPVAFAPAAAP